ncbi:ABC transporter permease [Brucepastera parasyntrophica]|uniref:ABC transporter permease n=1 Tax=Brucepastera parasyntrophica TaxID=2880008 RepID=UPI00210D3619|nr:ABC transporter permease [Brucepastera parasyntrophica]ULQ58505.1 ABC transporter permease [Brucepastera parasyntrophica]
MLKFLLEKEFKVLLRDRLMIGLVIGMPILMMVIFPWVATQEIKNIKISIVDNDRSSYSERLTQKIISGGYFVSAGFPGSYEHALRTIEKGQADMILEIRPEFEKDLIREGASAVMVSANAVNTSKGVLGINYLMEILNDFADELRSELQPVVRGSAPQIRITSQNRFNPQLNYKMYMIPAIMVMLLTILNCFLPALSIVGEKEAGTMEQLNVSPVNKFIFILSKLTPYWIIGIIALSLSIGVAVLMYGITPVGNLFTIYFSAMIYIIVCSGLGLVISNYSNTMQQAMFVMFFFVMILILMSGLFTPVASMPEWGQIIAAFNPLKYFIQIMRQVYLKGSGISDLSSQLIPLSVFAAVFSLWAVLSYRKNS